MFGDFWVHFEVKMFFGGTFSHQCRRQRGLRCQRRLCEFEAGDAHGDRKATLLGQTDAWDGGWEMRNLGRFFGQNFGRDQGNSCILWYTYVKITSFVMYTFWFSWPENSRADSAVFSFSINSPLVRTQQKEQRPLKNSSLEDDFPFGMAPFHRPC